MIAQWGADSTYIDSLWIRIYIIAIAISGLSNVSEPRHILVLLFMNYVYSGDDFRVLFHNEYSDLVVDFLFR